MRSFSFFGSRLKILLYLFKNQYTWSYYYFISDIVIKIRIYVRQRHIPMNSKNRIILNFKTLSCDVRHQNESQENTSHFHRTNSHYRRKCTFKISKWDLVSQLSVNLKLNFAASRGAIVLWIQTKVLKWQLDATNN